MLMYGIAGSSRAAGASISKKQNIRILVADDHPIVRKGLQSALAKQGRVIVVGEACDGQEAIEKALQLLPDVVLMDLSMPRMTGLDATRELRKHTSNIKVLVLSGLTDQEWVLRSIRAGAHGFISKEASLEKLLQAIDSVHSGQTFFTPEIAQAAVGDFLRNPWKREPATELTAREREGLVLIAEGKSNKEVATDLNIGVRTVETHRERIMRRLNIHSVAGLTKFAVAHDLVPLETGASL